ncbi:MAG: peptidoglycan DD-metalloendopeptidase family protein [Thermomicrobiales bacterium]
MPKTLTTPLSRRTVAAMLGGSVLALAAGPTLAHDGPHDATPDASPSASPVAASVPAPTTADVLPAYRDLAEAIQQRGKAVVDALLTGKTESLAAMLSPEMASAFPASQVTADIAQLQANQVRFSFLEVGAHWAGTVGTGLITGFFQQGGFRDTFTMTPKDGQASPTADATPVIETQSYPAGTWSGMLDTLKLPFEITLSGDGTTPAATLTIAEQGIIGVPLADVAFLPEARFGAVTMERAVPLNPALHTYGQVREWAGAEVQIDASFDGDAVTALQIQPTIILPEDPAAGYTSTVTYRLPWQEGAWFTFWGGDTEFENYHAVSPSQRHAYDIVVWKDGSTFDGDGSQADQYWIWGQPLTAPAAGTVVEVLNDQPDQKPGPPLAETNPDAFKTLHPAGNHIVLQTADHEFVFMAHMQRGSVRVQQGDILEAGDIVGLVGNSGNTSEPHLHIHVQNVEGFSDPKAAGLPLIFSSLTVDGAPSIGKELVQGSFVEPVAG